MNATNQHCFSQQIKSPLKQLDEVVRHSPVEAWWFLLYTIQKKQKNNPVSPFRTRSHWI